MPLLATALSVCLLAFSAIAVPAHAQLSVAFVSGTGNDSNDCASVTTPCRTIGGPAGALSKVASVGTIQVLPGSYTGRIEITKSVSIVGERGSATVDEIVIGNSGDEVVRLQGLVLSNTRNPPVIFSGSGSLVIEDCSVVHGRSAGTFAVGTGLFFHGEGGGKLVIRDSSVSSLEPAESVAIRISGSGGSGDIDVLVDSVAVGTSGHGGIRIVNSDLATMNVTLRNSVVAGSELGAIKVEGGLIRNGPINVLIEDSSLVGNAAAAVSASVWLHSQQPSLLTIRVRNSTIVGNGRGLNAGPNSRIISLGGNVVAGNTINGSFTSTQPPK